MADGRDAALRAILPSQDSEYIFDGLTEAETAALEEAFGDGFGDVGSDGHRPMPTPQEVRSGLLSHRFFVSEHSEYDHEEYPDQFWDWRDDRPPPSEDFPLGFLIRKLRIYFENQLDRFCAQLIRNDPDYGSVERDLLEGVAADRLYEKPWYEFHALRLMKWMEPEMLGTGKTLPLLFATSWSGKLGRLVEQYYWKFRFEKAAITGLGSRQGASTGGRAKARLHLAEQSTWQRVALEIWASKPALSKTAVANAIKIRFRSRRTAKHIARFIHHP